ncbi:MAG: hypothetical protein BGWL_c2770 [Candidatus Phytoplasma cynodontis]|nr:MAG: hypothetical protein BGWL_c2770 [Candidatus Phytoplasma cynodontis]
MRIIPYELFEYTPELSIKALRKEFGMYDYCLNKNKKNKAMQFFLDMGRNYFNLSFVQWIKEMQKRKYYINSFHLSYLQKIENKYEIVNTNLFLILECCIQWEIKNFLPYKKNVSWFEIIKKFLNKDIYYNFNFNLDIFDSLKKMYIEHFMKLNQKKNFKPKNLDMTKVFNLFSSMLYNKIN